jgi:hypothetical protein
MSTKTNLSLDIAIFSAFLVASAPALTGLAIHEWLSAALAATLLFHLLVHWNWVAKVTQTFFKKLFHASRLNYLMDTLLFVAMITVMLSGFLISKNILATFNIQLDVSRAWRALHSLSADATLLLTSLHFALHWTWIVSSMRRYIFAPIAALVTRLASGVNSAKLVSQPVRIDSDK